MTRLIKVETDRRGVARITLNRPDKHNALSPDMLGQLERAARDLATDPGVRVVVLTGAGPTFCAGGDLAWMRDQRNMDRATRRVESARIAHALGALADLPQPLIGRLGGNAFGGGVGLASVCDVVIGVDSLKMGLTEVRLGLIPANIGPYVIARMGATRARQVFMNGRVFDATEAVRLDLLTRAVPADALDRDVEAEIAPYLDAAPGAVAAAKALLRQLSDPVTPGQVEHAIDALADVWEGDEAAHGIDAFFDKSAPRWKNGA